MPQGRQVPSASSCSLGFIWWTQRGTLVTIWWTQRGHVSNCDINERHPIRCKYSIRGKVTFTGRPQVRLSFTFSENKCFYIVYFALTPLHTCLRPGTHGAIFVWVWLYVTCFMRNLMVCTWEPACERPVRPVRCCTEIQLFSISVLCDERDPSLTASVVWENQMCSVLNPNLGGGSLELLYRTSFLSFAITRGIKKLIPLLYNRYT